MYTYNIYIICIYTVYIYIPTLWMLFHVIPTPIFIDSPISTRCFFSVTGSHFHIVSRSSNIEVSEG